MFNLGVRLLKYSTMVRPKVLMTSSTIPDVAIKILKEKCDLLVAETKQEIVSKIKNVDAVFWASHLPLNGEIISAASCLKTVGTMSAGYNHIDVDALKKRGITLGNTPNVLNDAVADVAVLLTLAAARRAHEGLISIQKGTWKKEVNQMLGQDIAGSTVGIIGLGGIGQSIVKRLKAFNVGQFLYTGHREKPEGKNLDAKFVDLETLNRQSDYIIISCPLNDETRGCINKDFFSKTKQTAVLVNVSRGEIVDQEALIEALKEGNLFAAGLDVMTPEPLPDNHELLRLPNVVLMPHLGSATRQTRDAMASLTAKNILRGLNGEKLLTPVC